MENQPNQAPAEAPAPAPAAATPPAPVNPMSAGPTTEPVAAPTALIGYWALVSESWTLAWSNLPKLGGLVLGMLGAFLAGMLAIILMVGVGTLAFSGLEDLTTTTMILFGLIAVALYLAWIMLFTLATIGFLYSVVKRREGVGYWQGFGWSMRHIWPIFIVMLYMQLVIAGGYLFLIIPGIVLSVYAAYGIVVFASEGTRGMTALVRSTKLIYGHWWSVVGRFFFLTILILLGFVAAVALSFGVLSFANTILAAVISVGLAIVGYLVVLSIFVHASVLVFEGLQALKPAASFVAEDHKTLKYWYIVLAVIGIPTMIAWNAFSVWSELQGDSFSTNDEWYLDDSYSGEPATAAKVNAEIEAIPEAESGEDFDVERNVDPNAFTLPN